MALFTIKKTLEFIKEKPFLLEKEIQELTEQNLQTVLNLDLVKSEFALNGFRIDSLAYDKETNAFVIIEYKRSKNFSVIDQGYSYLSLMLNNKADFILEYNERKNRSIKRSEVDWSQSRIIFISPSYTKYQREAINFKDLPIELWTIKRYENNTISYEPIQNTGAMESINTISKSNSNLAAVAKEIKVYTEEEHLTKASQSIKELYDKMKTALLTLEDFEIKPKKVYIAFTIGKNIVDLLPQKKALKIWINMNKGELDDPKHLFNDVSTTGHWGNGDYETKIHNDNDLEYILSLVKQSVKKNIQ